MWKVFLESKPIKPLANQNFRKMVDPLAERIPLPVFNVDYLTAGSLLLSLIFVLIVDVHPFFATAILFLILLLDWCDGVFSRKFFPEKSSHPEGWLKDLVADRMAHGIIALKFFFPFFYLFIIDLFLIIFSIRIKKQYLVPYHFVFIAYMIFRLVADKS